MTEKKKILYQINAIVEVDVTDEILTDVFNMAYDLPPDLSAEQIEIRPWLREISFTPWGQHDIQDRPKLPRLSASRL